MIDTNEQLEALINKPEGEHLEFKEAQNNYHFDKLVKYCCALANEGGGDFVLGVTDQRPRKIVGTQVFPQPERTRLGLIERLRLRISFSEIKHTEKRVLVFHVPSRPVGMPVNDNGIYWMRRGDELVSMSEERLREIFAETEHDFSADICSAADVDDLDTVAVENFRQRWIAKTGNQSLANLTQEQLLGDIEAVVDGGITFAALILFGTHKALGRHLSQAEVVFEYRSSDASGPAQHRQEFRRGFFSFYDSLWTLINLRNDLQHYQEGLFLYDIPTFAERPVREAILNAISHRNYQLGGSVFIRQYPRRLVFESPGGSPIGVTLENILDRQSPRNRRIADIFAKCGLVERSGQGMNLMFEQSIQQSKPLPDFTGTDQYQVVLTLNGQVQNPRFLQFLEKIGQQRLQSFGTQDFLILDLVHREQRVPPALQERLRILVDQGVIETFGRGRGCRYMLARQYYVMIGKKGDYTRKKGLDRNTNKELLVQHIKENSSTGSRLSELMQVLPKLSKPQVQSLLKELKSADRIYNVGATRAALWYPGPIASKNATNEDKKTQ